MERYLDIDVLVNKTLSEININEDRDEITFTLLNGEAYRLFHDQDCCEGVYIDDICGDLDDLIGSPVVRATKDTNEDENPKGVKIPEYQDSFTWTFYNIATAKGHVTIRWYGESNGYYSESVDFVQA